MKSLVLAGLTAVAFSAAQATLAQAPAPLELSNAQGALAFKLEVDGSGGKFVDGKGAEQAVFKRRDDSKRRVLLITSQGQSNSIESKKSGTWKLMDKEGTVTFILKAEEDGRYKLKTPDEQTVYRIKQREYGLEIETGDDKSLYKIRADQGKLVMKNAEGKVVYTTKSTSDPLMFSCFGFDKLGVWQRSAMACAVSTMR